MGVFFFLFFFFAVKNALLISRSSDARDISFLFIGASSEQIEGEKSRVQNSILPYFTSLFI